MKRYTYVLLCLLLGTTSSIFGQGVSTGYSNFLPPSPSAGASGASGGGLAHGMSGVSIPLASFSTNQLSVPVSLSYYSTGTKVDQLASNVGLGWSLHAGGVINRTVRDDKDEVNGAAYPSDMSDITDQTTLNYIGSAIELGTSFDTEPDLFSFNFMGYSGSFVLDANDQIHVMPYQNLKIETDAGLNYFHVTTPNGIRYEFGGSGAIEQSKSATTGTSCSTATSYSDFVNTAWYLKKIVHPLGETIDFEYNSINQYTYTAGKTQTEPVAIDNTITLYGLDCPTSGSQKCDIEITVKEIQLIKISATNFGSIDFTYTLRSNPGNLILNGLIVKDVNDAVLRKTTLTHDFTGNDRMFLVKLTDLDKNDVQEGVHVFDYYDRESLPERLYGGQDHWGYYNGPGSASQLLPLYDVNIDGTQSDYDGYFDGVGVNRSPDASYAKIGMLRSIVYPSSMFTTYEYEANLLEDDTETGGLRLAKVTNHDPVTGYKDITRYYYNHINDLNNSSGHQDIRPNFFSYYSYFINKLSNPNDVCEHFECEWATLESNSLNALYNTSGQHITYEYVTIGKGENFDNGAIEYKYLLSSDTKATHVHGDPIDGVPLNNLSWNNGLVDRIKTYKKDAQQNFVTLRQVDHNYNEDNRLKAVIPGAVIQRTYATDCEENATLTCTSENSQPIYHIFCRAKHTHNYGPNGDCEAAGADNFSTVTYPPCYGLEGQVLVFSYVLDNVDIMEYENHIFWYYLKSTTTSTYDEDGNNPVTSTVTYNYDDTTHAQLTSVESDASIEGTIITSYTYPEDYGASGSTTMTKLIDKHVVGIPIETVKTVGGEVISAAATKFTYDATHDWVVPESFYAYEDTGGTYAASTDGSTFSSYTKKGEILARDSKGQVISQRAENNVVSTVIRGYDQTLVVASITNATAAEVQTALPALGNDLSAGAGALSASDLTTLKTALPNALITSYAYKIGYGVETTTDPNGRVTTYEYDDYGRVKYVRDHDSNIRSASEYHNKSQVSN